MDMDMVTVSKKEFSFYEVRIDDNYRMAFFLAEFLRAKGFGVTNIHCCPMTNVATVEIDIYNDYDQHLLGEIEAAVDEFFKKTDNN